MIYNIRYFPSGDPPEVGITNGEINIHQFVAQNECAENFRNWLRNTLIPIINPTDSMIQDGALLRNDLRNYLFSSYEELSFEILTMFRDCFVVWVSTFWFLKEEQKIPWTKDLMDNNEIQIWSPGLYVRTGNVELRVLTNFLMGDLPDSSILELEDSCRLPKDLQLRKHWLDETDINLNIRQLMTNAGWFPNQNFDLQSLSEWNKRYSEALWNSTGLFRYAGLDFYEIFFELTKLKNSGQGFNYLQFPAPRNFYRMLEGHNVLLVTPFATEIRELYESGDLFHLWLDFDLPPFTLTLIQSPMSIYPNRAGADWSDAFNQVTEKIDDSFSRNSHTLFFASSGCYGLPLCDFVHRRYSVASVYQGNWINYLFGIRQNATENQKGRRNLALWRASSLEKIAGLASVDDGRYVFDSTTSQSS
jgi:hypothetical protein